MEALSKAARTAQRWWSGPHEPRDTDLRPPSAAPRISWKAVLATVLLGSARGASAAPVWQNNTVVLAPGAPFDIKLTSLLAPSSGTVDTSASGLPPWASFQLNHLVPRGTGTSPGLSNLRTTLTEDGYAVHVEQDLDIFNVSNPDAPVKVGEHIPPRRDLGGGRPDSSGNWVLARDGLRDLLVYDLRNETAPVEESYRPDEVLNIAPIGGGRILASVKDGGNDEYLAVWEVGNPANVTEVGRVFLDSASFTIASGQARPFAQRADGAIIVASIRDAFFVNATAPTNMTMVGRGERSNMVLEADGKFYLGGYSGGPFISRFSGPIDALQPEANSTVTGSPESGDIAGPHLALERSNTLFELWDRETLTQVASLDMGATISDIDVRGQLAAVSLQGVGFQLVELGAHRLNGTAPITPGAHPIQVMAFDGREWSNTTLTLWVGMPPATTAAAATTGAGATSGAGGSTTTGAGTTGAGGASTGPGGGTTGAPPPSPPGSQGASDSTPAPPAGGLPIAAIVVPVGVVACLALGGVGFALLRGRRTSGSGSGSSSSTLVQEEMQDQPVEELQGGQLQQPAEPPPEPPQVYANVSDLAEGASDDEGEGSDDGEEDGDVTYASLSALRSDPTSVQ